MASSIASVTHTQPTASVQRSTASNKPAQPQPAKAATDTVQLSAAAQRLLAKENGAEIANK
jgi:hypothetical protein